jgi:RNA polymerase sigma factor (sigma-70 family)
MLNTEESLLIEGCLMNDRLIQKKLYDKYSKAMFNIIYKMINDYDEANDILQEAFIQVFLKIAQFRKESTLGAWIKIIVIRTTLKHIRESKKFETLESVSHKLYDIELENIDNEAIEKLYYALPHGVRTIFNLVEIEGYKHKEVAGMLGITVGTSKSQLFKAKRILKEKLKHLIK